MVKLNLAPYNNAAGRCDSFFYLIRVDIQRYFGAVSLAYLKNIAQWGVESNKQPCRLVVH
jgi:hypothetical protein